LAVALSGGILSLVDASGKPIDGVSIAKNDEDSNDTELAFTMVRRCVLLVDSSGSGDLAVSRFTDDLKTFDVFGLESLARRDNGNSLLFRDPRVHLESVLVY